VKVEARSGDILSSITRAQEGTAAAEHAAGKTVELLITAEQMTDIHTAINALETLGLDYLLRDGSRELTADWDPGNGRVIGNFLHTEKVQSFAVGDANFGFAIVGGFPTIYLDLAANDYIQYDRDANTWTFAVGGVPSFAFSASGPMADTIGDLTPGGGVTVDGVLLKDSFAQLTEIATPSDPAQNNLRLFARASGDSIQAVLRSSTGQELILGTLLDGAPAPAKKMLLLGVKQ
jgi:hypothetical protein